jgi:DNA-binding HxlR family transcriptional regulator
MPPDRTYQHFCLTARALEVTGERWSLLIVSHLLFGPRRFTDLARSLGGVTPTRLTERLRHLEATGIVLRASAPMGRAVWYRLTDAGRDLEPAIDALTAWGMDHAREPPRPGEPVPAEALMIATKVLLNRGAPPPSMPVCWAWRFPTGDPYALRFDDAAWRAVRAQDEEIEVAVVTTPEAWAALLTSPREGRRLPSEAIRLDGRRAAVRKLARAFGAELA